mgnify:CR=1 FL=1
MSNLLDSLANRQVYSVSQLNNAARDLLENQFRQIWVEGEISNFSAPGSGHWYFSLKDDKAQIRCAMFRNRNRALKFRPKQGDHFIARGQISLYPARGDYQLIVENLSDAGAGAQQRAFEELKAKLDGKGWFDPEAKQTLPKTPKHIAVITSATGAVWHDIQTTAQRRYPFLTLSLLPVRVQGDGAASDIVNAFNDVADYQQSAALPVEAIILARGGGSLEDLQAFNDEAVASAIHNCEIPVTTGVGHETDFTIADFVADQRAATPTAATELLTPNIEDYHQNLANLQARQQYAWQRNMRTFTQNIDNVSSRLKHPSEKIRTQQLAVAQCRLRINQLILRQQASQQNTINTLKQRLSSASLTQKIETKNQKIQSLTQQLLQNHKVLIATRKAQLASYAAQLNTASPLATLARGYSMVSDSEATLISKAEQLSPQQIINIAFVDGVVEATVNE